MISKKIIQLILKQFKKVSISLIGVKTIILKNYFKNLLLKQVNFFIIYLILDKLKKDLSFREFMNFEIKFFSQRPY